MLFTARTHALSCSPNTALCFIQPFEENSTHYDSRFHYTTRGYDCVQHTRYYCRSSVIDLYVAETDSDIRCHKSTVNPWKPWQMQITWSIMQAILHPRFLSLYYFSWHSGLAFSALEKAHQPIGLELGVSDSFLSREMRCTSLGECHHLSVTSWLTSAEYWYFKLFTWWSFSLLPYVIIRLTKPQIRQR